ncbi:hypothetical protein, partial [Bacillus thuringiensis]|uniref:hypothetical protein n=1 Tax=Bacillus thuringiensis TaxID=1428 RepID=UPI000C0327C4
DQNAGQAYTANPINTNVSAGAQCIPFVTSICPAPISVVVSVVACNANQNAGQSYTANPINTNVSADAQYNQTGSMSLCDLKQTFRKAIEQIESLEKTNDNTKKEN